MCEETIVRGFVVQGGFLVEFEGPFAGQVVLHCNEGKVVKYDVNETRRPDSDVIDLMEGGLRKKSR